MRPLDGFYFEVQGDEGEHEAFEILDQVVKVPQPFWILAGLYLLQRSQLIGGKGDVISSDDHFELLLSACVREGPVSIIAFQDLLDVVRCSRSAMVCVLLACMAHGRFLHAFYPIDVCLVSSSGFASIGIVALTWLLRMILANSWTTVSLSWISFRILPSPLYRVALAYLRSPSGCTSNSKNSCPNLPCCVRFASTTKGPRSVPCVRFFRFVRLVGCWLGCSFSLEDGCWYLRLLFPAPPWVSSIVW